MARKHVIYPYQVLMTLDEKIDFGEPMSIREANEAAAAFEKKIDDVGLSSLCEFREIYSVGDEEDKTIGGVAFECSVILTPNQLERIMGSIHFIS